MGGVKGNQAEAALFDLVNNFTSRFGLNLGVALVAPPNQDICILQIGKALFRIIQRYRVDREIGGLPKMIRDLVAQEIRIDLLLSLLSLIPDHDANRRGE